MQFLRKMLKSQIVKTTSPIRADVYLATEFGITRSYVKKLCDDDLLRVNNKPAKCNKLLKEGDLVEFTIPETKETSVEAKNIPIEIIYQDEDLAVINKPQGLTVHAGNGTGDETLVNALLYHLDNLSGINGVIRPGIVHRIDKNTSGLLVVAKNDKAHLSLAKQLEEKTCSRTYLALLEGEMKTLNGTVDTFIGRDKNNRTKMAVLPFGRQAVTEYSVEKIYQGYTLCKFSLKTGRTHQIRVHAKYLGHPVVGDKEYGFKNQKFNLEGQLLHAYKLKFVHPTTNKLLEFVCPLPEHFNKILKKLKEKL